MGTVGDGIVKNWWIVGNLREHGYCSVLNLTKRVTWIILKLWKSWCSEKKKTNLKVVTSQINVFVWCVTDVLWSRHFLKLVARFPWSVVLIATVVLLCQRAFRSSLVQLYWCSEQILTIWEFFLLFFGYSAFEPSNRPHFRRHYRHRNPHLTPH